MWQADSEGNRALATKPDALSLIPADPGVEWDSQLLYMSPDSTYVPWYVCPHTCTCTQPVNVKLSLRNRTGSWRAWMSFQVNVFSSFCTLNLNVLVCRILSTVADRLVWDTALAEDWKNEMSCLGQRRNSSGEEKSNKVPLNHSPSLESHFVYFPPSVMTLCLTAMLLSDGKCLE